MAIELRKARVTAAIALLALALQPDLQLEVANPMGAPRPKSVQ